MAQAAGKTDDPRMKLLAAGNAGMGAMGSAAATQKALADGDKSGGVKLSLTVGSSQSTSQTTVDTTTAVGSSVEAGGRVNITAHGAGKDSSLRIEGGRVKAGGDR